MSLKLHAPFGNPRANKIFVTAALANVVLEHVNVSYSSLETPEFLAKNPLGKVPVLETPEGYLTESNAILRYIARGTPLVGTTDFLTAKVNQWLDFASFEVEPHFLTLVLPVWGYYPIDPNQGQAAHNELAFKFRILNKVFEANNFLVGESLTIADINLAIYIQGIYTTIYAEAERKQFAHVLRWFEQVTSVPAFREFCGRTRYCKQPFPALQFVLPQQQPQEQQQQQKKEKAPKQDQQKEKAQKGEQQKQQQPKQAPKEKKEAQDEDEEKPQKKECPFDKLPPSKFSIDDWKRQFLASKDFKTEFEWLWQNFDAEGWSVWEVQYLKTENEGKSLLPFRNNCNGFLQRTDPHFKKFAFAIHGIYGEEPNLEIRGAWMWRGTDVAPYLLDHPTYEFLKVTKLDHNKAEDRARFEEYWINQTEDESLVQGLRARQLYYFR